MNNELSVGGKLVFDSNYGKDLPLTIEALYLICSWYDEYQTVAIFNEVYYEVSCVNPKSKTKNVHK